MKAILTLILVVFFGATALAQNTKTDVKVTAIEMDMVLDTDVIVAITFEEVNTTNTGSVARLYKFKNSRIKKALAFRTKRNRAKLA
ncbi:MAG: hypothetical protein AAFO99_06255 [Bacteroidota bacterium]